MSPVSVKVDPLDVSNPGPSMFAFSAKAPIPSSDRTDPADSVSVSTSGSRPAAVSVVTPVTVADFPSAE